MFKALILPLILSFSTLSVSFAQRKVLVEQFTNSGCPPCALNTPVVASYVNAHPNDYIMLAYHSAFPYSDSMYFENQFQNNQRVSYYGVSGVPTSRVDGNFFSGNLVPNISTVLTNASVVAPRYSITILNFSIFNNLLQATVHFESLDANNSNESLTAQLVIAEKAVQKNSYVCCAGANNETEYPWVVRKMLPDENGSTLVNKTIHGTDDITVSWNIDNVKDISQLHVIAFVQNNTSKSIYQTQIAAFSNTTGINFKNQTKSSYTIIPTVAHDYIIIQPEISYLNASVKIVNILGKSVYSSILTGKELFIETSSLQTGIYFVIADIDSKIETKKFIIKH